MWQRMAIRGSRDAVKHGRVFVKHVVPAVVKPARTLWNEVIGFIFIAFAVFAGSKAIRSYTKLRAATPDTEGWAMFEVIVAAGFTLLMAYFGITSFLKARRIARS